MWGLPMDYELRVVVEKVFVSSQEVVKRETLKVYDVKAPASILELGLRHSERNRSGGSEKNVRHDNHT